MSFFIEPPALDETDFSIGSQKCFAQILTTGISAGGHRLRWTFDLDGSYVEQSRVRIEIWSANALRWNTVWDLDPKSYSSEISGSQNRFKRDSATTIANWQILADILAIKAEDVLRPPAQQP